MMDVEEVGAKEEEFIFEGKVHPLLIPNVVKKVMMLLGPEDLKSSRAVCSLWNEEASKMIKSERTVMLCDDYQIVNYMTCVTPAGAANLHANYEFTYSELNSKILEQFFHSYGGCMKTVGFGQRQMEEKELYKLLSHAPSLKSLFLRTTPFPVTFDHYPDVELANADEEPGLLFPTITTLAIGDVSPPAVISVRRGDHGQLIEIPSPHIPLSAKEVNLIKLIKRLPNLDTLEMTQMEEVSSQEFSNYLFRCLVAIGPETTRKMVSVNFPFNIEREDELLTPLASLEFTRLSSLDINLVAIVPREQLTEVIMRTGAHLEQLSLTFSDLHPYMYNFGMPTGLCALRILTLKNYQWSLNFLQSLFALKSLTLIDVIVAHVLPNRYGPLRAGLEVLKIIMEEKAVLLENPEVVWRIVQAFPNLKVLHAPGVGDAGLRSIYMDLPFLEELCILRGTLSDPAITGFRPEFCADLLQTLQYRQLDATPFRINLYLGSLEKIRILHLESELMTILSVLFGVLKCNNLREVTLKSPLINDEAIESFLFKDKRLDALDVKGCTGLSADGRLLAESLALPKSAEIVIPVFHSLARPIPISDPKQESTEKLIRRMLLVHNKFMTKQQKRDLLKYVHMLERRRK